MVDRGNLGRQTKEEADELSSFEAMPALEVPVEYNPAIPIETFDVIVTDECHRSIYKGPRQRGPFSSRDASLCVALLDESGANVPHAKVVPV